MRPAAIIILLALLAAPAYPATIIVPDWSILALRRAVRVRKPYSANPKRPKSSRYEQSS